MKKSVDNKTLAVLRIVDILRQETDSNHKITQGEILSKLDRNYNLVVERKTIHRHLENLQIGGCPIEFGRTGCYWDENERPISDGELKLLIDSVQFSKHISTQYANDLMNKLKEMGTPTLKEKTKVLAENIDSRSTNREVFLTIEELVDAIAENKQVSIVQSHYDKNGELVPVGSARVISPLKLFTHANHYYLFARSEEGENEFLRVEKLTSIKKLKTSTTSVVKDQEIDQFLSKHPYMFWGEAEQSRILLVKEALDDFIDAFGKQFLCVKENARTYELTMKANPQDLLTWAMQNCMSVEVLEPQSVRDALRTNATALKLKYDKTIDDEYSDQIKKAKQTQVLMLTNGNYRGRRAHQMLTQCAEVVLDNVELSSFDFLADFDKLRSLKIKDVDVRSLNMLENKESLTSLMLVGTAIESIDFFATLPNLKRLVIVGNPNVKDYSVLYKLRSLKDLTIDKSVKLDGDIEGVSVRVGDEKMIAFAGVSPLASFKSPQRFISKIYNADKNHNVSIPPVCSEQAMKDFDAFLAKVLTEEQIWLLKESLQRFVPLAYIAEQKHISQEYAQAQIDKALKILRTPENRLKAEQIFFGKIS